MKKIGIDIHGVLDANPKHFVEIAERTLSDGGEVHIMTGIEWSEEVKEELMSYGNGEPYWTHFMSIITYLRSKGEPGYYDERGRYWFYNDDAWDKVKGIYCEENNIAEIYDDTRQYRKHMPSFTNFFLYSHDPVKHEMKLRNPHLFPKPQPADHQMQEIFEENK
ncbi:hypothetical protein N9948_00875 [bacterium]|nr:hypothetical protein [bacterium]